jgi:hypothetical protein
VTIGPPPSTLNPRERPRSSPGKRRGDLLVLQGLSFLYLDVGGRKDHSLQGSGQLERIEAGAPAEEISYISAHEHLAVRVLKKERCPRLGALYTPGRKRSFEGITFSKKVGPPEKELDAPESPGYFLKSR